MNFTNRTPCKTCPYRRDVPIGVWHRSEYENLRAQDARDFGSIFQCHQTRPLPEAERQLCIGWVLDQRRRSYPCLSLRMIGMAKPDGASLLNEAHDGGASLYASIEEMCRANIGRGRAKKRAGGGAR